MSTPGHDELSSRSPLHTLGFPSDSSDDDAPGFGRAPEAPPLQPTHDPQKGFMRFMPPLVREINAQGVAFKFDMNGETLLIDGFYKNGPMKVEIVDDVLIAVDKSGHRSPLKSYDDLVALNFEWWKRSSRGGVYVIPERPWLDVFQAKKWVRRQIIYQPIDLDPTDI